MKKRCWWPGDDPIYIAYHDEEWGMPLHDECMLFEFLILEGVQAGLSWITVLKKRPNYRKAMDGFDYEKIARYPKRKIESLLRNEGLVRNRLKMESAVRNARAFIAVREEFGSFDEYLWDFVDGKPINNRRKSKGQLPATTALAETLSKDLKKRGFNFVGPTICYAFMQAVGMVNDHTTDCFRHKECS
jgi:DNA-3-methyladenine glycosylase I